MVETISALSAGTIAVLLEVSALVFGLVVGANLEAVSSLLARLYLYRRGRVRLADTRWSISIVDGVLHPRRLTRDVRTLATFTVAVAVVALEALAVYEAQPGRQCTYSTPRQWSVRRRSERCYVRSFAESTARVYASQALALLQDADMSVGIPTNTDIFDKSVLTGVAVKQLAEHEEIVKAPFVRAPYRVDQKVYYTGLFFQKFEVPDPRDGKCGINEEVGFSAVDAKIVDAGDGTENFIVSRFVHVFACKDEFKVSDCSHPAARFDGKGPREIDASCVVYELSREGRRTSTKDLVEIIAFGDVIDADEIRRASLALRIAQTSSSNEPCMRYVAIRKECTAIGAISIIAVALLAALAVSSTCWRLYLRMRARHTVDWNSSSERLVRSVYEFGRRSGLSGAPEQFGDDMHVAVVVAGAARDSNTYQLAWIDGEEPADVVHRNIVKESMMKTRNENAELEEVEEAAICRGREARSVRGTSDLDGFNDDSCSRF